MTIDDKLRNTLNAAGKDRQLTGIVAHIEHPATGLSWAGSYGDCADDTPFFQSRQIVVNDVPAVLLS